MSGSITEKNYPEFKRMYERAVKDGKTSFVFEGTEVLVSYAKYVVEFIEQNYKIRKK